MSGYSTLASALSDARTIASASASIPAGLLLLLRLARR